jgi:hypothetical protein
MREYGLESFNPNRRQGFPTLYAITLAIAVARKVGLRVAQGLSWCSETVLFEAARAHFWASKFSAILRRQEMEFLGRKRF